MCVNVMAGVERKKLRFSKFHFPNGKSGEGLNFYFFVESLCTYEG